VQNFAKIQEKEEEEEEEEEGNNILLQYSHFFWQKNRQISKIILFGNYFTTFGP
jgi:hypothetical protein